MKLKIFTLRFSDTANGFDDKPIQEFTADKEVIEYTEHFFIHDKTPYLTVLLSYHDFASDEKRKPLRRSDPRMELKEDLLARPEIDTDELVRSVASMVDHIRHADTRNLRAPFFERPGAYEALTG